MRVHYLGLICEVRQLAAKETIEHNKVTRYGAAGDWVLTDPLYGQQILKQKDFDLHCTVIPEPEPEPEPETEEAPVAKPG